MNALEELHNELYRAQRTESVAVLMGSIGKARVLLARYRESLGAAAADAPTRSLLRKAGEPLVCYCPPGVCQAPKGFKGPCNRAAPAATTPAATSVGTASMYAQKHSLAVTTDWMIGWNACLDAIDASAAEPWMEQEAKYEAQMRETHAALQADDTPLETGEGDARG